MTGNNELLENFHSITNDTILFEWCENIGNEYYIKSKNVIPVIIEKYYKLRDIQRVEYSSKITSKARLLNQGSCFIIQLNSNEVVSKKQLNHFIAHEIAHTFFFKKVNNELFHIKNVLLGSDKLEILCDRIARCLVLPKAPFTQELDRHPTIVDESFSLKTINNLSNHFNITHNLLLRRATNDLGLWNNYLLLRLKYFGEPQTEWRLFEHFLNFTEPIFIPPPDSSKEWANPRRYPKVKGNFWAFLENCRINLEYDKEEKVTLSPNDIYGKPLEAFLKHFDGRSFDNCLMSKVKFKGSVFINLLMRLPL